MIGDVVSLSLSLDVRCSPSGPALATNVPSEIKSANATNSIVMSTLISLLTVVE